MCRFVVRRAAQQIVQQVRKKLKSTTNAQHVKMHNLLSNKSKYSGLRALGRITPLACLSCRIGSSLEHNKKHRNAKISVNVSQCRANFQFRRSKFKVIGRQNL